MELAELERHVLSDIAASSALPDSLAFLCDECNGRFGGSEDARRAAAYILDHLRASGLTRVRYEPFQMLGWVRGTAALTVSHDCATRQLPCAALPGSPPGAIEAAVTDVGSGTGSDFGSAGERVRGSIVLVDGRGPHRLEKYARAYDAGAVGFLFAHAGPGMLIPTGSLSLGAERAPLPGVGIAFETASYLRRLGEKSSQVVRIGVDCLPREVEARNVVGEIPGGDPDAGWIIACAHYDGHDVAQGAQDNATGTAVMLEAARVLAPLRASLTAGLRFCLFSGEEMGLRGSFAYVRDHPGELNAIRAVLNADVVGLAAPIVLAVQNHPQLAEYLRDLGADDIGVLIDDGLVTTHSDHFPFVLAGVPAIAAHTSAVATGRGWGHTAADTLDKLDVGEVREAAGSVARMLLRMAASPEGLPHGRRPATVVEKMLTDAGLEESLRIQRSWPF